MSLLYYNKMPLRLSTQVWTVQVGVFLNYLGWGAVLPFEIIYLHDGRRFGLGVAGLALERDLPPDARLTPPAGRPAGYPAGRGGPWPCSRRM
jgi:hypothetical protein